MTSTDRPRIWTFTVDYRKDGGSSARALINRGFWVNGLPRLMPLCRLLGHRPVVDGVDYGHSGRRSRWVACDRCGVRTNPQGPLDEDLVVGQPYTDTLPGPWPRSPRGGIGGQVVVGRNNDAISAEVKVGNAGSEHVLAGHIHLGHLGALYLHTEGFGQGLQRRLNPVGYDSRVTGISAHDGHIYWRLWGKRDHYRSSDPWWQRGSIQIDPRTILWGPKRYSYTDVGDPVTATVRMPHGDDHEVKLQLQRQSLGRARLPRKQQTWIVDWSAKPGIPTRNTDRGTITASAVPVSDAAVEGDGWVSEACAAIAAKLTRDRSRHGYRAPVSA